MTTTGAASGRPRMALVSDVGVGYGTPQLLRMADSFAEVFGAAVDIFEPDPPERRPIDITKHVNSPYIRLERIYTSSHPYSMQGRIEFCMQVAEKIRNCIPQILLFSTMYGIEILDRLDARRMLKIFYCLEDIDFRYEYLFPLVRRCDVILFPEENRARIYADRLSSGQSWQNFAIIYNTNDRSEWTPPEQRLRRLFYGGTFDEHDTFGEYFLRPEISRLPIDIYGNIRGFRDPALVARQLRGSDHGARFRGYREADDEFFKLLSCYLYSIVIWAPDREDRLYAAPNKLFDAIACGVPPIAAPHPQCVAIIDKWKCGILLDDWSFKSLRNTLERALRAAESSFYGELAANCRQAMVQELSWARQFETLVGMFERQLTRYGVALPEPVATGAVRR